MNTTRLEITRGDTKGIKFCIKNEAGEVISDPADKVYFTVKKQWIDKAPAFQKTLEDMTFDDDSYYHFRIESEDTAAIPFGQYVFDIKAIIDDEKTTLLKGALAVTEHATHRENEV